MSEDRDDGGPVFPVKRDIYDKGSEVTYSVQFKGMSLRDWFAGQALVGLGTLNPTLPDDLPEESWPNPALLARRKAIWAYLQADAMLKERGKTP